MVASLSTSPVVGQHAAVAVIGVLVEAQVGDEHHVVADLGAQVAPARPARCRRPPRPANPRRPWPRGCRTGRRRGPRARPARPPPCAATPACAGHVRAATRSAGARRFPPARTAARSGRRPTTWSRRPCAAGSASAGAGAAAAGGSSRVPAGAAPQTHRRRASWRSRRRAARSFHSRHSAQRYWRRDRAHSSMASTRPGMVCTVASMSPRPVVPGGVGGDRPDARHHRRHVIERPTGRRRRRPSTAT